MIAELLKNYFKLFICITTGKLKYAVNATVFKGLPHCTAFNKNHTALKQAKDLAIIKEGPLHGL